MRKPFAVAIALLLILCLPLAVSAHATLIRTDPQENAVLAVPPASVSLWFDEDLDPRFSSVTVLDSQRARVDAGNQILSAEHRQMSIGLKQGLPRGAYTVSWRAVSATDGHDTRGVFAFYVGVAAPAQPATLPAVSSTSSPLPLPAEIIVRWINLLAALALYGALTVGLLAGDAGAAMRVLRQAAGSRMRRWVVINLIVLFVGTIASQLLQAMAASERSLGDVLAQSIWLQTLVDTRFGQAGLARILLVDALLVLFATRTADTGKRIRRLWNARALDIFYVVVAALILLTFSLASHSAASGGFFNLALLIDWLHLHAIGAWMGGLFTLALVLKTVLSSNGVVGAERAPAPTQTVLVILRRFTNLAIAAVVLFALTGLYSAWRHVGYPAALIGSTYGVTLIIKNLMLVPLLFIGLINTLLLRPDWVQRLAAFFEGTMRRPAPALAGFQALAGSMILPATVLRYVRIEAALGVLVVLAAAALTALPPGRISAPQPLPPPFEVTRQAADMKVTLRVAPYVVGSQTYQVTVTDLNGAPLSNVTRVTLHFTFLGTDLGTATADLQGAGGGLYNLQGAYLSVVGEWKVEAYVRRAGVVDDARIPYRLSVIDPASSRAEELPPLSTSVIFAAFDLAAGIGLLIFARRRNIPEGKWIGLGALALGLVLLALGTVFTPPASAGIVTNPIVPDETSLARGKDVYTQNCAVCHGPAGRGNGPLAIGMNPPPADFVAHVTQHSDETLFDWISKGIAGTSMQGWDKSLSETDRWHTINYIQALAERASAPPTPVVK
jgi:copper transport protein